MIIIFIIINFTTDVRKQQQLINNQSINNYQNIVCPGQRNTKTQKKKIINTTRSRVCICNHISSIILFVCMRCASCCVCSVHMLAQTQCHTL